MKKKLFGILLFSVLLSSLAYAEADADKMRERRNKKWWKILILLKILMKM